MTATGGSGGGAGIGAGSGSSAHGTLSMSWSDETKDTMSVTASSYGPTVDFQKNFDLCG